MSVHKESAPQNVNGHSPEPSARQWVYARHGVEDVPVPSQEAIDRYDTMVRINKFAQFMRDVATIDPKGMEIVQKNIEHLDYYMKAAVPDEIKQRVEEVQKARNGSVPTAEVVNK